jgi:hypothetical protein
MELSDKHLQAQEQTNKLLRDLIIIQLGLAGIGQREIRSIVGGSMNDINRLAKMIRKSLKPKTTE